MNTRTHLIGIISVLTTLYSSALAAPAALSEADWSGLRAVYEAGKHRFERMPDGTHTAHNPGLKWRTKFDDQGFTAQPLDAVWSWGLELEGVQKGGVATVDGARLSWDRGGGILEWFINDTRGLEQGWTLQKPVKHLNLRVRGTLPPIVSAQSVQFGAEVTYSGLKAWDAQGKALPTWFEESPGGFLVKYDDAGAVYPVTIDPLAQRAYVKASVTDAGDRFGHSLAVSGDTVVIGAYNEDSDVVAGTLTDNSAPDSGAAYVFVRAGSTWVQEAYLKASVSDTGDHFGYSVAISGNTILVGAPGEDSSGLQTDNSASNAGAVYVFVRTGTTWSQQAYLKASNPEAGDEFGASVAVSGNTAAVGAWFEDSNALGINAPTAGGSGTQADNSASAAGAAYVFLRSGVTWSQQAFLKASNTDQDDRFGYAVDVDLDTVVVSAIYEGSNTGINGTQSDNSIPWAGAVYVFKRTGTVWAQQAFLKASNRDQGDEFGKSLAVDADTVIVGAWIEQSNATGVNASLTGGSGTQADNSVYGAGAAYVFVRSGSSWSQQAYLKASNTNADDRFGRSVALKGEVAVVGAIYEDSNGLQADNSKLESGAAYVFERTGSSWVQQAYLKPSNTDAADEFGISVAVDGGRVWVGAWGEDSNATGINAAVSGGSGTQADNTALEAGAAYVFSLPALSLAKSGLSVLSNLNLGFGTPGFGAVRDDGRALLQSGVIGTASLGGRNKAMFGTIGSPVSNDLLMQLKDSVGAFASGLTAANKVSALTSPSANNLLFGGLFQGSVSGTGITPDNDRLLVLDDGALLHLVRRSGLPLLQPAAVLPKTFKEVVQSNNADLLGVRVALKTGVAGVTASKDSGIVLMDHTGTETATTADVPFEGELSYGGGGAVFGEITGPVSVSRTTDAVFFRAKELMTGSPATQALFHVSGDTTSKSRIAKQGTLHGGQMLGTFLSLAGGVGNDPLFRATIFGSPAATNQGVFHAGTMVFRKGTSFTATDGLGSTFPGLRASQFKRMWVIPATSGNQYVFHVTLSGAGVTTANNQALILLQEDSTFLILARKGAQVPGIGGSTIKLGNITAVEVNSDSGDYAILASLTGAPAAKNQVLLTGKTDLSTPGDPVRLPGLRLRKGDQHISQFSNDLLRSISLKPTVDITGGGGRGLGQIVGSNGSVLVTLKVDRNALETLVLEP